MRYLFRDSGHLYEVRWHRGPELRWLDRHGQPTGEWFTCSQDQWERLPKNLQVILLDEM